MRRFLFTVLTTIFFACESSAQDLTAADKAIVHAARGRYYNLELQGFLSATCQVHFDLSTLPVLQGEDAAQDRKGLESTHFFLHLDSKQRPYIQIVYPGGTSADLKPFYAPYAENLKSIATGFFSTWPSKGLNGPVPPYDSQIESVVTTAQGYRLSLRVPGGPVQMDMDKAYLVTKISSINMTIDEKPIYTPSPEGLIFSGSSMTGEMEKTGPLKVQYEIESQVVDGLHLPAAVRLRVNENEDVQFTLKECEVTKGKIIELKAP